jgi:hypothetical protein
MTHANLGQLQQRLRALPGCGAVRLEPLQRYALFWQFSVVNLSESSDFGRVHKCIKEATGATRMKPVGSDAIVVTGAITCTKPTGYEVVAHVALFAITSCALYSGFVHPYHRWITEMF